MAKSPNREARTYNRSLSRREVRLLSEWERERRVLVTLGDIRAKVGQSAAPEVASDLVRKRVLERVRPGSYVIRPFRAIARPSTVSTPVAVEAILRDEPHYLGGPWALSFHHLTEQRYDSIVDAFVTHRLQPRSIGPARVRFHVLAGDALKYGIEPATIEGVSIPVSDTERTILDALDHPRVFFGVARAVELAKDRLGQVNLERLLAYAVAGSKPSTCQRLGVLLQRAGLSARRLAKLRARARDTRSLLSMNPDAARTGPVNEDWSVVENDR